MSRVDAARLTVAVRKYTGAPLVVIERAEGWYDIVPEPGTMVTMDLLQRIEHLADRIGVRARTGSIVVPPRLYSRFVREVRPYLPPKAKPKGKKARKGAKGGR